MPKKYTGYDGIEFVLLNDEQEEIIIGNTYKDFRGDPVLVTAMRPPHKPGSAGYISSDGRQYYASVIGARWVRHIEVKQVTPSFYFRVTCERLDGTWGTYDLDVPTDEIALALRQAARSLDLEGVKTITIAIPE